MEKKYLYGMIVLAIIFTLLAVFGTSNHIFKFYDPNGTKTSKTSSSDDNNKQTDPDKPTEPDKPTNPDKPADPNNATEINGYKCTTTNCKLVDGTSIINDQYAFIQDGTNNIILYDKKEAKALYTLEKVIPAGINYIALKSGQYGLLNISSSVKEILAFSYNYIDYNESESQYTVTTQSNSSYITNNQGQIISPTYVAQIIQYNDKYIITRTSNNEYHIFNFNNREFLTEYSNSKTQFIELVGDYVGIITEDFKYVVYDFRSGSKVVAEYQLEKGASDSRARIKDNKIEIYRGATVLKTIDL